MSCLYQKGAVIEDLDGIHLCEFDTFIRPQKPQTDHILDKFQWIHHVPIKQ